MTIVTLLTRAPDIAPDRGRLVWSPVAEFSIAYTGYSAIIPYVEHYLNAVMNRVRRQLQDKNPEFATTLADFVKQESTHARYHLRFNECLDRAGIDGLRTLIERIVTDLKTQLDTKSLAFNAAYCAGFESIATYDARYIFEECDEFLEGADASGANLLLWHVAEEFEHRSVCHDAFQAVSGNYFTRVGGLLYAFWHIGAAFVQAESLVLNHYQRDLSPQERRASQRQSRRLFWRQLAYVAPRMLRIFSPWYDPSQLGMPPRIAAALRTFAAPGSIAERISLENP